MNNESWRPFLSDENGDLIPKPSEATPEMMIIGKPLTFAQILARYHNLEMDSGTVLVTYEPPIELSTDDLPPVVTDQDIKDAFKAFDDNHPVEKAVFGTIDESLYLPTFNDNKETNEPVITRYPPIIVNSHMFRHVKTIEEKMATSVWVKKDWYIRPAQFVLTAIVFIPREIIGDGVIIR